MSGPPYIAYCSETSSTTEPVLTPSSTPSDTPRRSASTYELDCDQHLRDRYSSRKMDVPSNDKPSEEAEIVQPPSTTTKSEPNAQDTSQPSSPKKKKKKSKKSDCKKHKSHNSKSSKISKREIASSDSSTSDDNEQNSDSSSSSDSESEDEKEKRKQRKRRALRKKQKAKSKHSKQAASDTDSDSDDSNDASSDSDSSEDERRRRRHKRGKKSRRRTEDEDDEETEELDEADELDPVARYRAQLADVEQRMRLRAARGGRGLGTRGRTGSKPRGRQKKRIGKRASTLAYKRVDQLWDSSIHNYKLKESAEEGEDEFDQYVFTVRRKFDWENKYKNTVVDIKSKLLREALQEIMKDVKGVSLVEDRPSVDPNMLFLYLEELRTYAKKTLKARVRIEKKRKAKKRITTMISHCKVLLRYINEDYAETKKTLYPMLEAGNITFDLLWALFKPNSIAYTTTYGSVEDPRCFKVDYATKEASFMRGEWYCIEGRYLEYDGKSFGLGDFEAQVEAFKGPRKITSLASYPLSYHKDPEGLKTQLIERGKKFVMMEGMNYRFSKGLAFMKKKKAVAKVNINGRIMVDPAIFRRINPNYPISLIKPKDPDEDPNEDNSGEECSDCCGCDDSEDEQGAEGRTALGDENEIKETTKWKVVFDKDDKVQVIQVTVDADGHEVLPENFDKLPENVDPNQKREFTEEELLIASPVVLGFAFSEKLWLEFSLAGVKDIEWNEGAFESLVLPANQKSIVKALVESHKFHAAKTIDDVVQGKGKGLVAVLHGPPGTGKTLTAEGIAELLKCPLYMVSAGELGTDPARLEHELQKILDIAHSWGAVLLLDEADVFLEKREVHDIHRNALVSIFLRLLEYFQGILFLTTNRVETFDDAFQSRIHIALRYGELTAKAKKSVWKMFLDKVGVMEVAEAEAEASRTSKASGASQASKEANEASDEKKPALKLTPTSTIWTEDDYDRLARNNLNGRQIKNAVRTAQALAVNEKQKLSMEHIRRVLEVAQSFEQDLKGGTGYVDAMRSYT